MAIGNMVSDTVSILQNQFAYIQPTGTDEWTIHNIYIPFGATCELYRSTPTQDILITKISTSLLGQYTFHCSSSSYIRIKNIGSTGIIVGFDGLQSF